MLKFLDLPRTAFAILFLWVLFLWVLNDPDYFWHLEAGKKILADRALITSDPFTYTNFGVPWVPTEWLFQVVLAALHQILGDSGSRLVMALLGVATLGVTFLSARRFLGGAPIALLITLAFTALLAPFISPRPQLFSYLFFAIYLYALLDFKYFGKVRLLPLLPLLMLIWVNAHSGYMVGIVLVALFAACEWLAYWFRQRHGTAAGRPGLVRLSWILLLTFLVSAINPEGILHWLYPFRILQMDVVGNFIFEWQSPNFHAPVFKGYLALVLGFFAVNVYRERKPDLTEITLPLFFIAASLISLRHIPLAVLTMAPFVAQTFGDSANLGRLYKRWAGHGQQLGDMEFKLNWLIVAAVAFGMAVYAPAYHAGERDRINTLVPLKATDFILAAGINGRMFNTYHYGGYLVHRLYPSQLAFIDGRSDMFGDNFFNEYGKIYRGEPKWEEGFEKFKIDYVVCERNAPIRQLLLLRGDFRLVYDDAQTSVLVRRLPRFEEVIRKYGVKE